MDKKLGREILFKRIEGEGVKMKSFEVWKQQKQEREE
jgi:hypothetical protein